MVVKTKAIVISSLRYQEKSLIVRCFTHSSGLKSYFVPSAFTAKKKSIAYFQTLTLIEIEANHKNKGSLEHFKEVKIAVPYQTLNTDIVKSTIVIFLSEVLHHAIKEEEKNESLFTFLETALIWLDTHDEIANFHLILLLEITKFLGFYPDDSDIELPFFDIVEGHFAFHQSINCISAQDTFLFKKLLELKFDSSQKFFTASERQILLKTILDYYVIHLVGFKKPKSLEVLREVFE
ncbi:DNA repair protein RecO [Flavobacterium luminosum]|uniref:DNA repair protein RecO n=1 Tax=Flavobacterium luminosum TaxID=2949086 RepID=A0ABT0TLN1_9FLAO|nr:DNA repair protein RecO [Flavobacterium sp. HXWNR70]MCL9808260.1 DNA repair protein RecO [Flavobacterium sp. HXWNR70]